MLILNAAVYIYVLYNAVMLCTIRGIEKVLVGWFVCDVSGFTPVGFSGHASLLCMCTT